MKRNSPDFITAFLEWCGESEAPTEYLRWCAFSLLAAACGRRIFTPRGLGRDTVTYPNLYVMLVGPSGNYKTYSLRRVIKILEGTSYADKLNLYAGHVTHSGMYDAMRITERKKDKEGNVISVTYPHRKHFYLLNNELANDVGNLENADQLIRALTELYDMGPFFDDRSRSAGHVHIEEFSINWLSATTPEWLMKSITKDAFLGGFFGRLVMVYEGYTNRRIMQIPPNPKEDTLYKYLTKRIDEIFFMHGAINRTPEAIDVEKEWYESREDVDEADYTMSSWRRQYDLVLKMEILLALSRHKKVVDADDAVEAIQLVQKVARWQQEFLPTLQRGIANVRVEELFRWLKVRRKCTRTELTRIAYSRFGMRAQELEQVVRTWLEAELVEAEERPRRNGGTIYRIPEGSKTRAPTDLE
jgi:hypothetical protein